MPERLPIDKYSKPAYEDGLDEQSKVESEFEKKKSPLQAELNIHQELKKESASPYPYIEEEEKLKTELDVETSKYEAEVNKIKQDLWRQLGNAQTEATKVNDEMMSREFAQAVLPLINKIEDNTQTKLNDSRDLSPRAQYFGRAVLDEAKATRDKITSKKPTPAPETIQNSFKVVQELYRQFVNFAGSTLLQDRYGHDASGSVAM